MPADGAAGEHARGAGRGRPPQLDRRRAHADDRRDDRLPAPRPLEHRPRHHRPDDRLRRRHRHRRLADADLARRQPLPLLPRRRVRPRRGHLTFAGGAFSDSNGYPNAAASFSVHRARPDRRARRPGARTRRSARTGSTPRATSTSRSRCRAAPRSTRRRCRTSLGTFTLSGATGFTHRHGAGAGARLAADGSHTWVYRYWTTGSYTSGTVQVVFNPGTLHRPGRAGQLHRRRRRDAEHPPPRRPADADGRRHARPRVDRRHRARAHALRPGRRPASRSSPTPRRRSCRAAHLPLLRQRLVRAGRGHVDFIAGSFSSERRSTNLGKNDGFTVQQLDRGARRPAAPAR